ncbi:ester cyclase, partial [Acidobacteriia bacterium AH_259_A11_L15]|nr:ester cyclase [Acidobacteriia bacterium AH_259_A11_L15]
QMSEANKAAIRRFFEEVFNEGNLAVVDELVAPNYVLHDPASPDAAGGPEGLKEIVTEYRAAFSDLRLSVDDILAEGDKV